MRWNFECGGWYKGEEALGHDYEAHQVDHVSNLSFHSSLLFIPSFFL